MYKTKDISKAELKALAIKNQDEIVELTGSELDPVKAWEVIKQATDNFTKSDLKALEADALLYEMLHPDEKSASGEIYTMSDGFQWKLLSKVEAKKRFKADKEVYGIDRSSETEALIESIADLERFKEFGLEHKDNDVKREPKVTTNKNEKSSKETIRIQEKERARALSLLELDLLIAA
ncbi:hypothetical protein KZY98_12465 [Croceibacter atlanticus]|uniref:hypothetical protein n=1 Tax=Croceibacter atlanticus TaxID=313588 RepID=UPI001C5FCA1F|nr:hypothetical protein [Croceibacter atlanticus]MBW4971277.1 hypothetical protein [Croceibacter atlanticus]